MSSNMPKGWKIRKIRDIAEVVGGSTPDTRDSSNYGGSIPWITVKDLSQHKRRYIFRGERNITEKGLKAIGNRLIPKGSLLISSRAPIGYIAIAGTDLTTNQGIRSLVFKPNCECDPEFVYYLIKHNIKIFENFASGTTFKEITGSTIEELEFLFPLYPEQRKIAEILGSLDDKIELNYEMNKTLEALAQAIFKNWFVDFEPFKDQLVYNEELGKEIPEGWEVRSISDFFKCRRGMSYHSIYLGKGNGLLFTLGVLRPDGGINYKEIKRYNEKQIKEEYLIKPGDLLVGMTDLTAGTKMLGSPLLVPDLNNDKISCVHHFCILRRKKDSYLTNGFFYFLFKQRHFKYMMNKIATGTTVRQINSERIAEYIFIVPPREIVSRVQSIFDNILKLSEFLEKENAILEQIRDVLLPKLLSGEIRVKVDVEKELPEEVKKLKEIEEEKVKLQGLLDKWLK